MSTKPLHIPEDKRKEYGLKIDCSECGTLVSDICKKSGLPLEQCKFGHKHTFKVIAYEPNTGKRKTKNLATRDFKTACLDAALFQKEIKTGKQSENKIEEPVEVKPESAPLLVEALAKYVSYLRGGEEIPEHKRRVRNDTYCKYVERTFLEFVKCQKDARKVKEIKVDEVNEEMIGKFYNEIISYSGVTYNMKMGTMRTFYNYLLKKGQVKVNPFYGVIRKGENRNISVLTQEEYTALLDIIQKPELGRRKIGQAYKELYRPWLKDSISLFLASGRRSEELLMAKFEDIVTDKEGNMTYLNVIDYKVSRLQNRLEDNPKKIKVPITNELREALINCGAKEKIGSSEYIIGSDEVMDRVTMKKFLSRAFSHYWNQLEFSKTKKASFKILRKTYLSSLSAAIGISNARVISQHSDTKVLADHYVSDQVIGATAKNFSVFPKQEERQAELNKLRQSGNELTLEK